MTFEVHPGEGIPHKDVMKLLAWCINILGGSIVLDDTDWRRVAEEDWNLEITQFFDPFRLEIIARRKND